jgi:hypothetical protein
MVEPPIIVNPEPIVQPLIAEGVDNFINDGESASVNSEIDLDLEEGLPAFNNNLLNYPGEV